jgi:GntR family transcriptional regulator
MVFADDEPIALATAFCNLGEGITFTKEELATDSIFPLLERKYGIRPLQADRTIEAVVLLPDEAESLEARPGTPALLSRLTAYGIHRHPIVFDRTVYRGDRYRHFCPVFHS